MLIAMWCFFILIPLVFTWWGWKNVLIPFGLPLLKFVFVSILFLVWVGFASAVMASPTWYRTFGWNTFTVAASVAPDSKEGRELKWMQENDINPDGSYEPDWRQGRGLKPLSPKWSGRPEPYHAVPGWMALLIPVSIVGFMFLRNMNERRKLSQEPGGRSWDEIHSELGRMETDVFAAQRPMPVMLMQQAPVDVTPSNDADFKAALKGLGYKDKDINAVAKQCSEPTIEARIRHALQILVNV